MRHPTSGLSEDDLSRLTGSSVTSSSSSTPTHNNENGNGNCVIIPIISDHHYRHHYQHHHHHSHHDSTIKYKNTQNNFINSTYLPEIIDSLELQKSRKRKERQDSTSSIQQDRKLIRSNSEELITNADCEVIRRVSSHEDFKKPLQQFNNENILKTTTKNQGRNSDNNRNNENRNEDTSNEQYNYKDLTSALSYCGHHETSPARSHRFSPNIGEYRYNGNTTINNSNNKSSKENNYDDFYEHEHEIRRSSERSCKSRANYSARKIGVIRKSSKQHIMTKYNPIPAASVTADNESAYKYDISSMKYERRGFVSKVKLEERNRKEEAADGEQIPANDYNDNNLIDFHMHENYKNALSFPSTQQQQQEQPQITSSSSSSSSSDQQQSFTSLLHSQPQPQPQQQHKQTIAEALPWDSTISRENDQTPVLCRRFVSIDDSSNNTIISTPINQTDKYTNQQTPNYLKSTINNTTITTASSSSSSATVTTESDYPLSAVVVDNEPIKSFCTFTKMENLKTREIMLQQQNVIPPPQGLFQQTPEERLKHVNKKLQALKKRVSQLELAYEKNYGYRPSQVEKFNDKQIKSVLAEIGKLRKEKHELKSDPMSALGLKVSGGMDSTKRLCKIKETLTEIEKKLIEKRQESKRSENLDELNAEQLIHEKAAIQHSLLYFESLYGRPSTREERDAARPLYDRYRIIKRMVSRSVNISGVGASELPTILEHEAMAFSGESLSGGATITEQQHENYPIDDANISLLSSPSDIITTTTISSLSSPSSDYVSTLPSQISGFTSLITDSPSESNSSSAESKTENVAATMNTDTVDMIDKNQQQSTGRLIENIHTLSLNDLWALLEKARDEKKQLKRAITEYEMLFEEKNGRKMLKTDRKNIDDTYTQYKQKKAKVRLLQALIKKHISN